MSRIRVVTVESKGIDLSTREDINPIVKLYNVTIHFLIDDRFESKCTMLESRTVKTFEEYESIIEKQIFE